MWVGVWLTHGVPVGLSSRGVVALLVVANFSGGLAGALGTLALNAYPYKGRLVLYATAGYGVACFLFGCSPLLMSGVLTIFLMGAFDAVGATMRKQVVLLSTPDHLRGRAQSGHRFAANVANSIGQIYVALMVAQVGAGLTMQLGGLVTETMTCFFGWTIPSLLTFSTLVGAKHVDATRPMGTANEAAQEDERHAERLPQLVSNAERRAERHAERHGTRYPKDWQELNDAARAARDLEEGEMALAQAAGAARAAGPQRE